VLARIAARLLPLKASYWIADRVADLWYAASPATVQNLRHNLKLVPGVPGDGVVLGRLSRRIMRNFARMVTEFLYFPRLNLDNISHLVDIESFKRLIPAVGDDSVILLTGHIGNWELGAAMASMLGLDLHVVVYDHPDHRVARLFRERREEKGLKVMSVREAARKVPAALSASSVGVVGDRDFTGGGMEATYFGVPVIVPDAYAGLALARKKRIIPGFCLRQADGRYRLILEDPPAIQAGEGTGPEEIVETCLKIFEKSVEKYPDQWYFFERLGSFHGPA
jgi:KDO2-lipid IV(A) lauroyltransferase